MADRREKTTKSANGGKANYQGTESRAERIARKRKKQKRKLILFVLELLCLFALLVGLYIWSSIGKIADEGYTNIAIFGLDNRESGNYENGHSDTIMVASVNNETKEISLISVYRDTYLMVGEDTYSKANAAYYKGGVDQAVEMLNTNLDLDITEYVCVDWAALVEAIDALGGVEIEVTAQEAELINAYLFEIDAMTGQTTEYVYGEGVKTLTGAQATSYARIRSTAGDDFKRTSRQRIVLDAMLTKAKDASVFTLLEICNAVFDDISTSLSLSDITGLAWHVKEYQLIASEGFPFEQTTKVISGTGDSVIPATLESNVSALHLYFFGIEEYEPSDTVKEISDTIVEKTGVNE